MKKLSLIICILILLLVPDLWAKKSFIFLPLQNKSGNKLIDWIGYSFPEAMFRKASDCSKIQVWDPLFIYSIDTLGWPLVSDSLVLVHQKRWNWDYTIGGSYSFHGDTISLNLRVIWSYNDSLMHREYNLQQSQSLLLPSYSTFFLQLLSDLNIPVTAQDSSISMRVIADNMKTYATYATGYGYELVKEYNHAISAYSHVLEIDETFSPALYRMGVIYTQSRKQTEAKYYIEKAVNSAPRSPIIAAEMVKFLAYGVNPNKAVAYIENNLKILEKNSAGMKAIGMVYILTGEYQRAVAILTRAVATGPTDLETEFLLGRVYLALGQYTTAGDIFGRLIRYRPRNIRYYSFLGQTYAESGRLMESSNVLERAMQIEPNNVPNLINLANTYFKLGWYSKAEQYLLKAKNINPDLSEVYINLGVLYWHMGKKKEAEQMLSLAAQDKLSNQSALSNQGNILFLSGNIKKAIKTYKKADKTGKKSESTLYNLAFSYLSLGKTKEAIRYFDEVLLLSPDRIDVILIRAQLALDKGDYDKAELYYRKIMEISPEQRTARLKLINLFESKKNYKEAMKIVEQYLNDFPQDREYRLKLPDLYQKMGWYEVAIAEYQNLLKDKNYKQNYQVFLGLGKCQYDIIRFKKGRDYERAIYNLKLAIQLNPDTPEPDRIIGHIYKSYKNYRSLAIEHWEAAYKKTSDPAARKELRNMIAEAQK